MFICSGINDLAEVIKLAKGVVCWKNLGLELGLHYPTLEKIKIENHYKVDDCKREMLAAWLHQQDNVTKMGLPSRLVLKRAMKEQSTI